MLFHTHSMVNMFTRSSIGIEPRSIVGSDLSRHKPMFWMGADDVSNSEEEYLIEENSSNHIVSGVGDVTR